LASNPHIFPIYDAFPSSQNRRIVEQEAGRDNFNDLTNINLGGQANKQSNPIPAGRHKNVCVIGLARRLFLSVLEDARRLFREACGSLWLCAG
jgi:hypothetical protein